MKPDKSLSFQIGISPTLNIRGLIAMQDIKNNTVIERCPVILIETKYEDFLEKTNLSSYYFIWDEKYHCIVLGYGGIFNHSEKNNVKFYKDLENKIMIFESTKDIKKGEELFTNYYDDLKDEIIPEFTDFHKKTGKVGI